MKEDGVSSYSNATKDHFFKEKNPSVKYVCTHLPLAKEK